MVEPRLFFNPSRPLHLRSFLSTSQTNPSICASAALLEVPTWSSDALILGALGRRSPVRSPQSMASPRRLITLPHQQTLSIGLNVNKPQESSHGRCRVAARLWS